MSSPTVSDGQKVDREFSEDNTNDRKQGGTNEHP
jgi:hypothetical protein